jgi:chromosomal replication initiation ATPase DnaA
MRRPLRIEYAGVLHHITSRGNEKRDIFLRLKGLFKGKVVNEEIVERSRLREGLRATKILQVVAEKYGEEAEALRQRGRNKEARKGAIYSMKRYSGLSNLDIAEQFG